MSQSDRRLGDLGWLDRLIDALAIVAGVLLCGLTVLICTDVAARYFRLFAMPWSLDIAEYTLLLVTFLGAPWVLVEGGHISIDIFVDRLAPAGRRKTLLLSYAIGALVCAVLLVYSVKAWWDSFSAGTTVHETFIYPEWLLFSVPPPIFLILLIVFVCWLIKPPLRAAGGAASDGI